MLDPAMRLFAFERRWAGAIARSLVPAGTLGGTTDGLDAGALLADDCVGAPWHSVLLLRMAIWMVWLAPLRRGRLFGGLDEPARVAVLERLLHGPYVVRSALLYFKLTSLSVLLGREPALARIGAYGLR